MTTQLYAAVEYRVLPPCDVPTGATKQNPAALDGQPVDKLPNGALCWVSSSNTSYRWIQTSLASPDGVQVILPVGRHVLQPGRWIISSNITSTTAIANPVDTIELTSDSRLVDVDTSLLTNGTIIIVLSVNDMFQLDTDPSAELLAATDQITVVQPIQVPTHRWVRRNFSSLQWRLQAQYNINATTGNDENIGDSTAPLQTISEWQRRIGRNEIIPQDMTIIIETDLPATDPFSINFIVGDGALIKFRGQETVLHSGTFTATTSINRATQQMQEVEDTNLVGGFAPYVGAVIFRDTGAESAFIAKSTGAFTARTSRFGTGANEYNHLPGTYTEPTAGDTYEIWDIPKVHLGIVDVRGQSTTGTIISTFAMSRIEFDGLGGIGLISSSGIATLLNRCICNDITLTSDSMYITVTSFVTTQSGCFFFKTGGVQRNVAIYHYDGAVLYACMALNGPLKVGARSNLTLDVDTLGQGGGLCQLQNGSFLQIGTACSFDSTNNNLAVEVQRGSFAYQASLTDGINAYWGTGNAQHGLVVRTGGMYVYNAIKPSCNDGLGAGREALIGGADTLYAGGIPVFKTVGTGGGAGVCVEA